jgi:hypothetical protein
MIVKHVNLNGCISYKNATLLSFLHNFKGHKQQQSFSYQNWPQHLAHTSAIWKINTQHFPLKAKTNSNKYMEFVAPVRKVFFIFIGTLSTWRNP